MNKKLYTGLIAVMLFFAKTTLPAADYGVSIAPLTMMGFFFSTISSAKDPKEYIWMDVDVNFLLANNKEQSIGIYLSPDCYGLRYQNRSYTKESHAGFFYGAFAKLEYRTMGWQYLDGGTFQISYSLLGNPVEGTKFQSVGLTGGVDLGFRLRGEKWGATFFAGAGLPLFYCFGDLPEKESPASFYLLNARLRVVELGFKIDFYM
jgi:hypothetical protein